MLVVDRRVSLRAPDTEQGWKAYAGSLLTFSFVSAGLTFLLLRFQHLLPLNPSELPGLSADLAFNTAVSFMTNTNWQAYAGESTMSYLSQMVALAFHNFASAAAMLIGRFAVILPVLALAGSMGAKNPAPVGTGSFPVSGPTFILLVVGTVLLVGALNFLPVLSLGPVVEHFLRPIGRSF